MRHEKIARNSTSTIIPSVRYHDALKMIDWLQRALSDSRYPALLKKVNL